MISTSWIEKRRPHWTRLERLVEASGRSGVSALSPSELQELALLYRQIAADLATVREDPSSKTTALYLNQLLGRAHNLIYMGRKTPRRGILKFFTHDYPAIFRILADHNYSGWISIEDGMNGMEEMAESLAFLRRMCREYFGS